MCRLAIHIPSYVKEGPVRTKPPRLAPLTREEFVSKKLAPKLSQQLKVCCPLSPLQSPWALHTLNGMCSCIA